MIIDAKSKIISHRYCSLVPRPILSFSMLLLSHGFLLCMHFRLLHTVRLLKMIMFFPYRCVVHTDYWRQAATIPDLPPYDLHWCCAPLPVSHTHFRSHSPSKAGIQGTFLYNTSAVYYSLHNYRSHFLLSGQNRRTCPNKTTTNSMNCLKKA